MTKRQKFFSALGRFIKDFFTKNIILKIVVLLFSILLWGFVIAEENPEYTKRVYGVKVEIQGEDSLRDNEWMLVNREEIRNDIDVDVKCAIGKHSSLDASHVKCYIDLSTIKLPVNSDEDTVVATLEVESSVDAGYGAIEGTIDPIRVELARLASRKDLTVAVKTEGENPQNIMIELPKEVTITIDGQKSKIDQIKSCDITVNLSEFQYMDSGTVKKEYPVRFYDASKEAITDILTSDGNTVEAEVEAKLQLFKDVPIEKNIMKADNFETYCQYECEIGEQSVRLYAEKRETLDQIESVSTELISIKMLNEETNRSIRLLIPEGTTLENGSVTKYVMMYLRVTELMADPVEYTVPIRYSQTKSNIFRSGKEPDTVTFRVRGTVKAMEAFNEGWLSASVSIDSFNSGSYSVPVIWAFAGNNSYRIELLDSEDGSVKGGFVTVELLSAGQYVPPTPSKPTGSN